MPPIGKSQYPASCEFLMVTPSRINDPEESKFSVLGKQRPLTVRWQFI